MKHFSSNTNHKRALLFCALSGVLTLLPWHLAAKPAFAQATPGGQSQAQTPLLSPSQATSGTPSKKFSVVIDPGHGGADKGEDEKEINLALAFQLRTELERRGVLTLRGRRRTLHPRKARRRLRGRAPPRA
ncbi:MAG: hypothetical protein EOO77_20810 [Oxalobacteraceae bacterium]|nr:MAG: hypothetical protein EOO77_20810 [Oxalobacteraceae bacterium]